MDPDRHPRGARREPLWGSSRLLVFVMVLAVTLGVLVGVASTRIAHGQLQVTLPSATQSSATPSLATPSSVGKRLTTSPPPATATSETTTATDRQRHTFTREASGGIYLDSLPAEEGEPATTPPVRITGELAANFGEHQVHGSMGDYAFRISTADGKRMNLIVRIAGPNPRDFPLHEGSCSQDLCGPEGFFCSKTACEFGVTFTPLALGTRTAALLIGDKSYVLTGIGTPSQLPEENTTTSTSTPSPSST